MFARASESVPQRRKVFLVLVALCATFAIVSGVRAKEKDLGGDQDLRFSAERTLQDIIGGLYQGDYKKFSKDLSSEMKKAHTRTDFLQLQKKLQKQLGKFRSMEYLGAYSQYGSTITLFKARFSKLKDDVLIKLVLDPKSAEPKVTGLWLESPALTK